MIRWPEVLKILFCKKIFFKSDVLWIILQYAYYSLFIVSLIHFLSLLKIANQHRNNLRIFDDCMNANEESLDHGNADDSYFDADNDAI